MGPRRDDKLGGKFVVIRRDEFEEVKSKREERIKGEIKHWMVRPKEVRVKQLEREFVYDLCVSFTTISLIDIRAGRRLRRIYGGYEKIMAIKKLFMKKDLVNRHT